MISLGNTGGIFAAATFKLGRIAGVDRGCIATVIPRQENEFVLLDAGANIECKPLHLAQFAVMGSVYSREVLGRKKPRVGILSIGTEDSKGNELTLEAFKLCKQLDLNFIGNVEGHDLFKEHVDVVVCDGFVGNIVLKTCESLAVAMFSMLKRELVRNPKRQIGAYFAKNAFQAIRWHIDRRSMAARRCSGLTKSGAAPAYSISWSSTGVPSSSIANCFRAVIGSAMLGTALSSSSNESANGPSPVAYRITYSPAWAGDAVVTTVQSGCTAIAVEASA